VSLDLAHQASLIQQHASLDNFTSIKPMTFRSIPSYLSRRGLGVWVKLKLRSDSLPLLSMLRRYCKQHNNEALDDICWLCSQAPESALHFAVNCSALSFERDELLLGLESDSTFTELDGASDLLATWRSGSSVQRFELILRSFEWRCDEPEGADKLRYEFEKSFSPSLIRFEAAALRFLARIWCRRAELIGGIPSLNMTASGITLSQLKEDGRCRSFAVVSLSS
jgi:hypothetical protein